MVRRITLSLSILFAALNLPLPMKIFLVKALPIKTLPVKSLESSEAASPMVKVFSPLKVPLNLARHPTYSTQAQKALLMAA